MHLGSRQYALSLLVLQDARGREEGHWWNVWQESRDLAAAKLQAVVRGHNVRRRLWEDVRLASTDKI